MTARWRLAMGCVFAFACASCGDDGTKTEDEYAMGSGGAADVSTSGGAAGTGGAPAGPGGPTECLSRASEMGETQACAECSCSVCLEPATAIYGMDMEFEMRARAVVDCAREHCCAGIACYCGDPVDLVACGTAPAGPCVAEIEAAAGVAGLAGIIGPANDLTNPLGAAAELGRCTIGDPNDLGGAIVGMCPECMKTCN